MPLLQLPLEPFAVGAWPLLISGRGRASLGIWFSESDAHGREFEGLLCSILRFSPFSLALIPNEKKLGRRLGALCEQLTPTSLMVASAVFCRFEYGQLRIGLRWEHLVGRWEMFCCVLAIVASCEAMIDEGIHQLCHRHAQRLRCVIQAGYLTLIDSW